jgi:hypothetical protein
VLIYLFSFSVIKFSFVVPVQPANLSRCLERWFSKHQMLNWLANNSIFTGRIKNIFSSVVLLNQVLVPQLKYRVLERTGFRTTLEKSLLLKCITLQCTSTEQLLWQPAPVRTQISSFNVGHGRHLTSSFTSP